MAASVKINSSKLPCSSTRYVASINQRWFKRIMCLVPKRLQRNQKEIKRIQEEIKCDYLFAVKKSIVDFVLKEPEIDEDERFLDEDDETPMTIELAGVSNAWRKLFRQSRKHLKFNLFTINTFLLHTLSLWFKSYHNVRYVIGDFRFKNLQNLSTVQHFLNRFVDVDEMKQGPKMEIMAYQVRV